MTRPGGEPFEPRRLGVWRLARWMGSRVVALVAVGAACNADRLFEPTPELEGRPPLAPGELAQFRGNGAAAIAPGDTIGTTTVLLRAVVADPDSGDTLRLEVELRALDAPFQGSATHVGNPAVAGSQASVNVEGLSDSTAYHWQARAVDRLGLAGECVPFRTEGESGAAFAVMTARAPAPPSSPAQYADDGTTGIGVGAVTGAGTVVFAATVSDPDSADEVRLQVEVQPVGTVFTSAPVAEGTPVASGARASVRVSGLRDDTEYRWQYRALDALGASSPWVAYGDNADNAADFRVAVPDPPAVTSAGQFADGGATAIAVGESMGENVVVFAGAVTDPDPAARVRLQVEVRPVGAAFSGVPTGESAPMGSGERATIRVAGLSDDASYHWQYRAQDETGRTNAWTPFGGNSDGVPDFRVAVPELPAAGAAAQHAANGTAAIAEGGTAADGTVILSAMVSDPDAGAQVRLQVEVRRTGTSFTGSATGESGAVASGQRASVRVMGLSDDTGYGWQYRAIDETGRAGPWTEFGNSGGASDFRVAIPEAPAVPASLGQLRANGTTSIPVGGGTGGLTAVIRGRVSDPDPGDVLRLEVEVRPTGTAFSNSPTHVASGLASGDQGTVTIAVVPLLGYHWQARTCDGRWCTPWTPFGGNPEHQPDFVGTLVAGASAWRTP